MKRTRRDEAAEDRLDKMSEVVADSGGDPDHPRTRRQLLRLAGGAAIGGGLIMAGADPAKAADEGPLLMGNVNNSSGGDLTSLNGAGVAGLSVGVTGLSDGTTALSAASGTGVDLKLNGTGRLGFASTLNLTAGQQPAFLPTQNDMVKSTQGALWSGTGDIFDDDVDRTWKRINAVRVDNPAGNGAAFAPFRFVDTRDGTGGVSGARTVGTTTNYNVRNSASIPDNAIAIFGNLTVTSPTFSGWVTLWPRGVTEPITSSINFVAGQTVANFFFVGLGTAAAPALGSISIGPRKSGAQSGTVHIVVDITAYVQ